MAEQSSDIVVLLVVETPEIIGEALDGDGVAVGRCPLLVLVVAGSVGIAGSGAGSCAGSGDVADGTVAVVACADS